PPLLDARAEEPQELLRGLLRLRRLRQRGDVDPAPRAHATTVRLDDLPRPDVHDPRRVRAEGEEGPRLAREVERRLRRVVERDLAEAVARQPDPLPVAARPGDREHPVELRERSVTPAREGGRDDLRVPRSPELLTESRELSAELPVIPELPVVRERELPPLERLRGAIVEVDDRETGVTEHHRAVGDDRLRVRASVPDRLEGALHGGRGAADGPDDPAHQRGTLKILSRIAAATARIITGGTARPHRSHCCAYVPARMKSSGKEQIRRSSAIVNFRISVGCSADASSSTL